jgi:hypothetical protein
MSKTINLAVEQESRFGAPSPIPPTRRKARKSLCFRPTSFSPELQHSNKTIYFGRCRILLSYWVDARFKYKATTFGDYIEKIRQCPVSAIHLGLNKFASKRGKKWPISKWVQESWFWGLVDVGKAPLSKLLNYAGKQGRTPLLLI